MSDERQNWDECVEMQNGCGWGRVDGKDSTSCVVCVLYIFVKVTSCQCRLNAQFKAFPRVLVLNHLNLHPLLSTIIISY